MAANECIAYYEPGAAITGHVDVAVVGKRFVKINNNRQSGPGISDSTGGGNVRIAPATAAERVFGVASHDGAVGSKVAVLRSPGAVVPVLAGAAIDAFEEVEVGATGKAVPLDAGVAVGYAITGAANDADAQIHLYG